MTLKDNIKNIPVVGTFLRKVYHLIKPPVLEKFEDSPSYWEGRYAEGRNSGSGSYNHLATFKAQVINDFILENNVSSAIEFGCGDGNQLSMIRYPKYIGLDVSRTAIKSTADKFAGDKSKSFFVYDTISFVDNHKIFQEDASLSLDVIYHLVEDSIFERYIRHVFNAGKRFVIIYSSDFDSPQLAHVKNRNFTKFVSENFPEWKLSQHIKNPYEYSEKDEENTSTADFFIYKRS